MTHRAHLDKLTKMVECKELEENVKISFMRDNSRTMFTMDGADILVTMEFTGASSIMVSGMVKASWSPQVVTPKKEIGIMAH